MYKKETRQILILSLIFFLPMLGFSIFKKDQPTEEEVQIKSQGDGYFAGQTIEWIVPFKEGGGADTWARFNAPFFSKFLPGRPVVIINNIPGGGSIKGANLFTERATPDGLMLMGTSGSTQFPYLLDDPRVRYDYQDFKVVMAYPNGGVVYCSPELGIQNASELAKIQERPLKYGSQGPTSLDLVPLLSFDLLGLDVKAIFGFRGRGAGRLAFERGEVLIDYQTSSAYLKNVVPLVEAGSAIPLFSFGALDENGELIRDPSFPDLPHFGEVYEMLGKTREGIEWRSWFAFMSAGFGGMKLLLVPKETPDVLIEQYQKAITDMKQDPQYLETKEAALGLYEQLVGAKAKKIFELATNVGQEEKDWVKEWLRRTYDLNI
jgi:tripartite-type tricarboxylate transporter receptor subunit TctC